MQCEPLVTVWIFQLNRAAEDLTQFKAAVAEMAVPHSEYAQLTSHHPSKSPISLLPVLDAQAGCDRTPVT